MLQKGENAIDVVCYLLLREKYQDPYFRLKHFSRNGNRELPPGKELKLLHANVQRLSSFDNNPNERSGMLNNFVHSIA